VEGAGLRAARADELLLAPMGERAAPGRADAAFARRGESILAPGRICPACACGSAHAAATARSGGPRTWWVSAC